MNQQGPATDPGGSGSVRFGFRLAPATMVTGAAHQRVSIFAGRNPGARGNAGTLTFRADEWPHVREALLKGGFDEMEGTE